MQGLKKTLFTLGMLLCVISNVHALFGPSKSNVVQTALPFLEKSSVGMTELEALTNTLAKVKANAVDAEKALHKTLNKVEKDITETQRLLKIAQNSAFEHVNKKSLILNTRKQMLLGQQEIWKELIELIERHIALLKSRIEYRKGEKTKLKPAYSWKDFRDAQAKYADHQAQIELEKRKREAVEKQITREKESLASLQKQVDAKIKDQEKFDQGKLGGKEAEAQIAMLKYIADVFDQEVNLLNEKIDLAKLKIEKLTHEEKFKNDEISFLQEKLSQEQDTLAQIENRLLLDFKDVELAKTEWNNESQKALRIKENLNNTREAKNIEKEKLALDLEFAREKIKQLKEDDEKNKISNALVKSNLQKLTVQQMLLDREIQVIDTKKDIADAIAKNKELQYLSIDVRYRLKHEQVNYDDLINNFKNQKELELANFKIFKDKRLEAVTSLIENKRTSEEIKLKIDELKTQKPPAFKGKEASLETILENYEEARQTLSHLTQVTQDFFAAITELIGHQEAVLNAYEWIITDLESRKTIQSIWQRSSQAISLKAFFLSLSEAEATAKKFFWDTPQHLSLTVILRGLQTTTWISFFLLIWFFLFFIGGFILSKHLVAIAYKKITAWASASQKTSQHSFSRMSIHAIISFTHEYFNYLYILAFFYLHILFRFSYIFCSLRAYASPYNVALFHLVTIPVLIYLSQAFVAQFKELNVKLNRLFFAEKFQDRFIFLISLFFYSSAILLPLRLAFLAYNEGHKTIFDDVILAAYHLIVLVIVLFFFNKENVLKAIPTHTTFFIWFKRKIEKYYYPVFCFIMGLLILSNPSIGYSNLAWYLAFAAPSTIALFYALFLVHHYIRKYSVFLFMQEDEDEIRDKFEHAKTYYGFFVIATFLLLLFGAIVLLSRIWGLAITPADLWKLLSESWVIPIGSGNKLGFVQFMILVTFIISGFLTSSLVQRFILNKLFDILRTEPGLQNTILRIAHYTIISISILFGLVSIHIDYYFILTIGGMLTVGLGLALKDVLTDFLGGFLILLERPIEIGNYVQLDEFRGTVHKIAARTTTLITSRNHAVIIPNRIFLTKTFSNWGQGRFAVGFEVDVRVRCDSDPEQVKRVLLATIQKNPVVLRVPAIVARLEAFEADALYFLTRAFISARRVKDQWEIAAQIRMEILKAFKENQIELSLPERVISAKTTSKIGGSLTIRFDDEEKQEEDRRKI